MLNQMAVIAITAASTSVNRMKKASRHGLLRSQERRVWSDRLMGNASFPLIVLFLSMDKQVRMG
ncbi:MAG TPA: hypothetical protein VFV52_15315 [Bacilli bacterium]|nr:hypothetical protein [Bacilli bacterium]